MRKNIVVFIILFMFIIFEDFAWAYKESVHSLINEKAIQSYSINGIEVWPSNLNSILQNQIGFSDGIRTELKIGKLNQRIWKWVAIGGEEEDSGDRLLNHFHDPLKEWDYSGLWNLDYPSPVSNFSSILWGIENHNQDLDDDWSWEKAKQHYYAYLTGKDYYGNIIANSKDEREAIFAKCFRAVGQVMHLLQDASVPLHTRNDMHVFPFSIVEGKIYWGTYETYTEKNRTKNLDYKPDQPGDNPSPLLLEDPQPDSNYTHLPPVTGLFDRNQYKVGDTIPAVNAAIGLAEYSNANFLTQDTMWKYPHPVQSDLDYDPAIWSNPEEVDAEDGIKENRIYFGKSVGEPIQHLVAAAYWYYQLYMWNKPELYYSFILDEKCFSDYAAKLVPHAVGYSAELLDYFFRGKIDISLPDGAMTGPILKLSAKNTSLYGEEMTSGNIVLSIKYQVSGKTNYIVVPEKNGVSSISRDDFVELNFDLANNPIPQEASNIFLQIVYKGILGHENNGIGVGGKKLQAWVEPWGNKLCDNHDWTVRYFIGSGAYTNALCLDLPHHRDFSNAVKSTSLDISLDNGVFKMEASGSSNPGESVRMWSFVSWAAATEAERIPSNSVLRIKVDEANVVLGNPAGDSYAACYIELKTANNNSLTLCFSHDISSFYDPYSSCGSPCDLRDNAVHLHGPGEKIVDLSEFFDDGDYVADIRISTEIDENYSASGSYCFYVDYIKFEQKQAAESSL